MKEDLHKKIKTVVMSKLGADSVFMKELERLIALDKKPVSKPKAK